MKYRVFLAASIVLVSGGVVSVKPTQAAPLMQSTSGKCIQPINGLTNPGDGTLLVLSSSNCNADNPLSDFQRTADGALRHTSSGKCIHPQGGSFNPPNNTYLVLWNYCAASGYPQLQFRTAGNNSLQQVSSNKCIHPEGGAANPNNGTKLLLHDGCGEGRLAFQFASNQSPNVQSAWKMPWQSSTPVLHAGWHYDDYLKSNSSLDIQLSAGTPVLIPTNSTVTEFCNASNNHFAVKFRADDGQNYSLIHVKKTTDIFAGKRFKQGDQIGVVADDVLNNWCAHSQGAHLHFGLPSQSMVVDGYQFTPSADSRLQYLTSSNSTSNGLSNVMLLSRGFPLDGGGNNGLQPYLNGQRQPANRFQRWELQDVGNGQYMIVSLANNRYLDGGGNGGSQVYLNSDRQPNNPYQRWILRPTGSGYMIINVKTNFALDSGGANGYVYMHGSPNSSNQYQIWSLSS
jgi:hypothetical protein